MDGRTLMVLDDCALQYIWICLRLFQAVDAHSGYDFPWSLNKFIPFWAGAEYVAVSAPSLSFPGR